MQMAPLDPRSRHSTSGRPGLFPFFFSGVKRSARRCNENPIRGTLEGWGQRNQGVLDDDALAVSVPFAAHSLVHPMLCLARVWATAMTCY